MLMTRRGLRDGLAVIKQVFVENRDCFISHLHSAPAFRGVYPPTPVA